MLRHPLPLALAIILVLVSSPARAVVLEEDILRDLRELYVDIIDEVKDGCLPSPKALRSKIELILRSSRIAVTSEYSGGSVLRVLALGSERGSQTCAGVLDVGLQQPVETRYGMKFVETYWHIIVYTGPKAGFQSHLVEKVDDIVTELANEILKARQQ